MKSKKDFRKIGKVVAFDSDELRRGTKLKPVPKEKNVKRSLYSEIEEDEELFDSDELFDDDAYDDEDEEDF